MVECPSDDRKKYRITEKIRSEYRGWEGLPNSGNHMAFRCTEIDKVAAKLVKECFERIFCHNISYSVYRIRK